jgi:hypothetical protein
MEEQGELINLKDFLENRVNLIRNDYFIRNKNLRELVQADLGFPDSAFLKLENICK